MRTITSLLVLSASLMAQDTARDLLNRGVQSFKSARYREAVDAFQKAAAMEPRNTNAHLYLGTAWMSQYVPGAASPGNEDAFTNAQSAFQRALDIEPENKIALTSMASLVYQRAQSQAELPDKLRMLDETQTWYERLLKADPNDKSAHYSIGMIAWTKFYPALMSERTRLGMRPADPGPLPDASARRLLRDNYGPLVENGMAHFEKAIEIDPEYDDAMAYLNLLTRQRGDLRDTREEYLRDVATADAWVAKALSTKKQKAERNGAAAQPPLPPAPRVSGAQQRVRVGGSVQANNLIQQVPPVYPPAAVQARIQGTVRYQAIIGKDGRIENIQLVSGHPLLVGPATDAVKQWIYRPTLLNGEPVAVITQVDVNFTLP